MTPAEKLSLLGVILSCIAGLILVATRLLKWRSSKIQSKATYNKKLESDEKRCPNFDIDEVLLACKHYITPDCSPIDPANETEFGQFVPTREPIYRSVDRIFSDRTQRRHLLLLADSGVGKTSFCLNYFQRSKQRKDRLYALISLARPDVESRIRNVPLKTQTILMLDALDEDSNALNDGVTRLSDILKLCSDFSGIIVTCRSHFFENDAAIPTKTGISRITPRASKSGTYELQRLYLLPFDDDQVSSFLSRAIPWWNIRARRKAKSLTRTIPELSARPMLLALVPELVKNRIKITEIYYLYEYMVNIWYEREADWIDPDILNKTSNKIAIYLAFKKQNGAIDRVLPEELRHVETIDETLNFKLLTTRSLLNRDSEGRLKFSHRSIMEFLIVRQAISGEKEVLKLYWTGFMRELLFSYASSKPENMRSSANVYSSILEARQHNQFPHADALPAAGRKTRAELAAQASYDRTDHGSARNLPVGWRGYSINILIDEDFISVIDKEFGLSWSIPNSGGARFDRVGPLFRLSINEAFRSGEGSGRRRASFAEFISLLQADRLCLENPNFLKEDEFYWLGDRLDTGENLLVSLKNSLPEGSGVLILSTIKINGESVRLNLFAVDQRRPARTGQTRALDLSLERIQEPFFPVGEESLLPF